MRRATMLVFVGAVAFVGCRTGDPAYPIETTVAPPSILASATTADTVPATTLATTTTVPPDTTPPELIVLDPEPDVPVTTARYEFRGFTEPGATVVAAGRYDVEVSDAGEWSIRLVLNRGANLALFEATDPAGNTSVVRMTVVYEPPYTSPDYWTGRSVSWERSAIGRWAVVDDESLLWEQLSIALGASRSGHVLSISPPTERDPAQLRESFVWVLGGDVISASLYLAIPAWHEVSVDCYPADGSSGDAVDLIGIVAIDSGPLEPAQLWRLSGRIQEVAPNGFVCEG